MCQGCVDDGRLAQGTFDKIEAFQEKWPDSGFGPAHIVIGDDNVFDDHLDWCMGLIRAVLQERDGKGVWSEADLAAFGLDMDDFNLLQGLEWYENQDRDELEATLVFLQELRAIPEDDR